MAARLREGSGLTMKERNGQNTVPQGTGDFIAAIHAAKDPRVDPMRNPATAEPLGQIAQLMAHDNYDRDNRLNGQNTDTRAVHGWKKIDSLRVQNSAMDGLDMHLWEKDGVRVATVLSVAGPGEVVRNMIGSEPKSYQQAADKIAQWRGSDQNLIVVGHGHKGSTIALTAAQNQGVPAVAFAPDQKAAAVNKDAPVVAFDMRTGPVNAQDRSMHRNRTASKMEL